jgi:hypothetical protein
MIDPALTRDAMTIVSLVMLGAWLQTINGKHGLFDELLTPVPLGLGGAMLALLERVPW